jgi:hypothetical protein
MQQIVIENSRFTEMGLRKKRALLENTTETGEPIPDHISATAKDIEPLMNGLLQMQSCKILLMMPF